MGKNCGETGQQRQCSSNSVLFPVLTTLTFITYCDNETAFKKSGGFEMVIVEVYVICFQLFNPLGLIPSIKYRIKYKYILYSGQKLVQPAQPSFVVPHYVTILHVGGLCHVLRRD